jgi:hypothetical protein
MKACDQYTLLKLNGILFEIVINVHLSFTPVVLVKYMCNLCPLQLLHLPCYFIEIEFSVVQEA